MNQISLALCGVFLSYESVPSYLGLRRKGSAWHEDNIPPLF